MTRVGDAGGGRGRGFASHAACEGDRWRRCGRCGGKEVDRQQTGVVDRPGGEMGAKADKVKKRCSGFKE